MRVNMEAGWGMKNFNGGLKIEDFGGSGTQVNHA